MSDEADSTLKILIAIKAQIDEAIAAKGVVKDVKDETSELSAEMQQQVEWSKRIRAATAETPIGWFIINQ